MRRSIIYALFILLITGCAEEQKPLPEPNVYEIRDVGMLATTEYTIGKIVKLSDPPEEWYKYGDRKLLMSCKAKVKAGVDLTKIKEGDIKISGGTIEIKLPPAEITSFNMDPKQIRTEMESTTWFRDNFSQKEKNKFMRQGEEAIRKELEQTDILKDAERNARLYLEDFYQQMGFEKVIVEHGKEKADGG